tara:strand:- start:4706 stop:4993 length:288 start_codon:yes stop_codon:yes gene_type:complete
MELFKLTLIGSILLLTLVGCKEDKKQGVIPVPTGKGKIHGKLNERKIPCRFVKVERNEEAQAWQCIYDHPKSDVHDVVTVGEHNMCPKMVYCDQR